MSTGGQSQVPGGQTFGGTSNFASDTGSETKSVTFKDVKF